MSFVSLGGGGLRPTFFELVAAERLMPSLKAAVVYSLSVYAQRQPGLHRLLDREDELFFLLSVLLDRQALQAGGGSFAEGLYGLRRAPVDPAALDTAPAADAGGSGGSRQLNSSQRQMSLILLTLVPFLRSRLDSLYQQLHAAQQYQGPLGLPPWQQQQQQQSAGQPPARQQQQHDEAATASGWPQRWRAAAARAFVRLYPWAFAAHEGARFAYQLLYLLGKTPYYSPGLHLLGLQVVRQTGQEVMQHEHERQRRRSERLARLGQRGPGPWLWRLLRQGWARAMYAAADHTRSALILSVFAFKLLEWWYSTAEQRLGEQKALPPPPPPPPLLPAAGGVGLPPDAKLCPLCLRPRTNPAALATSGYVFCYPCIHREVAAQGRCPVTLTPARLEHVWRLYHSA